MAAFWTECYRAHFQKFFRKPFDVQVYHDDDGFSLKIAIHDWAARKYRVFASMGLADKLLANEEDDFGEVILFADVSDKEVPQLFINALFFILRNDIPLGSRFAIGGIDRMRADFAERYEKSALYFTLAADEQETFNKVRNGEEFGRVYQAYFISPAEDRYLDAYGAQAFEKLWQRQIADPLSVRRASLVSDTLQPVEPLLAKEESKQETTFKEAKSQGIKKGDREFS